MRLAIELVPRTAWYQNYRNKHPEQWEALRKQCYADAGGKCEICSASGRLEAHEVWEWNERMRIQRLVRLVALCPDCHRTKHFGLALKNGQGVEAFAHLMKVNNITAKLAQRHVQGAFEIYDRRSKMNWVLNCSVLED